MKIIILLYLILIIIEQSLLNSLTCKEVKDISAAKKKLTFAELTSMQPKAIVECLPHLAKEPLQISRARFIWNTLVNFYEGVANIPQSVLTQLNWVTVVIPDEDYENITIATIDMVRNFGLSYNLDITVLQIIAERVRQDFANKTPEDYTCYDLKALNEILCAFNASEIERIHPSAYKETAYCIGKLNCSSEVMTSFANLAVHKNGFGRVAKWTPLIVKILGNVADYVPGGIPANLRIPLSREEEIVYKLLESEVVEKKVRLA